MSQGNSSGGIRPTECRSTIDQQFWQGQQLLAETRAMDTGGAGAVGAGFGGRVVYTHGAGLDEPLSLRRSSSLCSFTVFPHTDFSGRLASGTFAGSPPSCAQVTWPGSDF